MGIEIGTLYVRRSAWLRATPERVWQEFTSFERLAAWFGRGHRLEALERIMNYSNAQLLEDGYNTVVRRARENEALVGTAIAEANALAVASASTKR